MGTNLKTRIFWNPETAVKLATDVGMARLDKAAHVLKNQIKTNLRTIIKHQISRPMYQSGDDKQKWWTARTAGELMYSARVVRTTNPNERNIWVMVGSKKAYYAMMFEFATRPGRGKAYFRPAISTSKPKMTAVLENG